MYKKLLIAYDGSEGAKIALERALLIASINNSVAVAIWVQGSLPHYPETVSEVEQEKIAASAFYNNLEKEVHKIAKEKNYPVKFIVKQGNPSKMILNSAEELQCDLIVVGGSGHSKLWDKFLGHVADKISENAQCDVLIVRKKKK